MPGTIKNLSAIAQDPEMAMKSLRRMISVPEPGPQTLGDQEATNLYGVGPSGQGRKWVRSGAELVLLDTTKGVIYRKRVGQQPPAPVSVSRPVESPVFTPDVSPEVPEIKLDFPPAPATAPKSAPTPVPPRRLQGQPTTRPEPPILQRNNSAQQDSLQEQILSEPGTESPDGQQSTIQPKEQKLFLPQELAAPERSPALQAKSDSLRTMIDDTADTVGEAVAVPDSTIVTPEAVERQSVPEASLRLVIDPNTNKAWIEMNGDVLQEFFVGTGDVTGERYGKKFYSPTGNFKINSEVPYKAVEGSYGPLWMGLDAPKSAGGSGYGLHGPHERAALEGEGFVNSGYVSHGCLRFTEKDILEIGKILDVGAEVEILPYH